MSVLSADVTCYIKEKHEKEKQLCAHSSPGQPAIPELIRNISLSGVELPHDVLLVVCSRLTASPLALAAAAAFASTSRAALAAVQPGIAAHERWRARIGTLCQHLAMAPARLRATRRIHPTPALRATDMASLARLLDCGAVPSLERLDLSGKSLGDEGVRPVLDPRS